MSGVKCTTNNDNRITTMNGMFEDCIGLTSITFPGCWDEITSTVTDMDYMFVNCYELNTINNILKFNTENVTSMNEMFEYCSSLESINVSSFDTKRVSSMECMFAYCSKLKTISAGDNWFILRKNDVYNGTDCSYMFSGDDLLVGGLGTKWTNMSNYQEYADIDGRNGYPGYLTYKEKITTLYGQLFTNGNEFTFKIGFDAEPETSYLITLDGEVVSGNDITVQNDKIFFTYKTAARKMIDTKTVKIVKQGGMPLIQKDVSMAGYLKQLYSDTQSSDKVRNMAGTILRYGAAAQVYKNYKTDTLANAGTGTYEDLDFTQSFDGYSESNTSIDASVINSELSVYGLSYYGINVSMGEDLSLLMAFKLPEEASSWEGYTNSSEIESIIKNFAKTEDLTFGLDTTKKYLLVSYVYNIKDIDSSVYKTSGFNNDISLVVYLYRSVTMSKNQNMINLAKALYAFHLAAKSY